jgi:hypothetical protein
MRNNEWKTKPIELFDLPDDIDYIFVIDENGSFGNFKCLVDKYHNGYRLADNEKHFTLTGILITREEYFVWKKKIDGIKEKYWENGLWFNKRKNRTEKIHFHSSDTFSKNPKDPFNLSKESCCNLISDITEAIDSTDFKIISSNICIESLFEKYRTPYDPYKISIEFVLERLLLKLNKTMTNAIVVFESRRCNDNKKGDNIVHRKAVEFLSSGNAIHGQLDGNLLKRIKGVYFNPKINSQNCLHSYELIELADLVTYPIYKSFKSSFELERKDFKIIERKFDGFPNYSGYGLKIFP